MKTHAAVGSMLLVLVSGAFAGLNKPQVVIPKPVFSEACEQGVAGDRLRVCSYNLEHFFDGIQDGEGFTPEQASAHVKAAAGMLDKIDPDLAFLIEVENVAMLKELNAALKKPFPLGYLTSFRYGGGRPDPLNLALLSRRPLESIREIRFHTLWAKKPPPRGILAVTVDLGGGRRLLMYEVHLKSNFGDTASNQKRREQAMRYVRQDAAQVVGLEPDLEWEVMAIGDMNVDPDNPEFKTDPTLRPVADWVDLWQGRPIEERTTVPTRYGDPALVFPPAAFDRVIVSPSLQQAPWKVSDLQAFQQGVHTNDVTVLPGLQGHVSDHYPIFVDLLE